MDVLDHFQKRHWSQTLYILRRVSQKKDADLIWFNARTAAVGFYERLGYQKVQLPFEIKEVDEHSLTFKTL